MLNPLLLAWLLICCQAHGVEFEFAISVMQIESGLKCGPLGKKGTYIGPGGIHKDFRAKWNIDDPEENIRVTVAALRGKEKVAILKRYNKSWWKNNYIKDTMALYRQNKRMKVIDNVTKLCHK